MSLSKDINAGIGLGRRCFQALRADKALWRFPIVSMIGYVVIALVMLILLGGLRLFIEDPNRRGITFGQQFGILLILIVFYIVNYLYSTVCNAALTGATFLRLGGEEPMLNDGLRLALPRIVLLLGYSALSSTVGVAARLAERFSQGRETTAIKVVGALVGSRLAGVWNIVTFLILPVLLVENMGLFNSMRRSAMLYQDAIGKSATTRPTFGPLVALAAGLAAVPGCLIAWLSLNAQSILLSMVAFVFIFVSVGAVTIFGGAMNAIFQSSLYMFITEGNVGSLLTESDVLGPFGLNPDSNALDRI